MRNRVVALADIPLPEEGPFLPGESLFKVSLEQEGKTQSRIFDPHTVSERYQIIGRQLLKIEKDAQKNIVSGLRLNFILNKQQIDREELLGLKVQLTGLGVEPINFYNPLQPPHDGSGRIALSSVRSDVKTEELQVFHRQSRDLSEKELVKNQIPSQAEKAIINLKPGDTISLIFDVILN